MNTKLTVIFGAFLLVTGASGLIGWAFYTPQKSNHRVAIGDSSRSASDDICTDIVNLSRKAISVPATDNKTKVTVFLTGDLQSANEPRDLGSFDVPTEARLTQGKDALAIKRDKVLQEIKIKCSQILPAGTTSIFLALKRAVEHLRALGCKTDSKCEILLRTDLQENAEPQIKDALLGTKANAKPLPAPIDNSGIAINVCGISQTKGETEIEKGRKVRLTKNRNASTADAIINVWKQLFMNPESVTFAPYCTD